MASARAASGGVSSNLTAAGRSTLIGHRRGLLSASHRLHHRAEFITQYLGRQTNRGNPPLLRPTPNGTGAYAQTRRQFIGRKQVASVHRSFSRMKVLALRDSNRSYLCCRAQRGMVDFSYRKPVAAERSTMIRALASIAIGASGTCTRAKRVESPSRPLPRPSFLENIQKRPRIPLACCCHSCT